jgi:hypothetical protein
LLLLFISLFLFFPLPLSIFNFLVTFISISNVIFIIISAFLTFIMFITTAFFFIVIFAFLAHELFLIIRPSFLPPLEVLVVMLVLSSTNLLIILKAYFTLS